jgi:predicted Zn finger-like uncharacterized protein
MQIVCPNCTTSYQIADAAVGANGRSVRCVRCQIVWHAASPAVTARGGVAGSGAADETVAAFRVAPGGQPAAPPEPAPIEPSLDDLVGSNASEDGHGGHRASRGACVRAGRHSDSGRGRAPAGAGWGDGAPLVTHVTSLDDKGRPDIESVAARRARATARRRRSRFRVPLPVAIVALVTLCVALLGWRKDVVRHAPQLASFYSAIGLPVNLRGLAFSDMKIGNEIHDGVPVLVVEGMIVSTVSMPVDVPRLRFALRSATGAEVYSWTAQPLQPVLGAFETMPFRSRLASPPAEGHDIQVRFFTRRDAVAGLR